jgi:hypothetical protein
MLTIHPDEPLAVEVVRAIHEGDIQALKRLLVEHPGLAAARLGDEGVSRSLLHVAADWPGHFPNGAACVAALIAAGADPNARFAGSHSETPLHWAASSDDTQVLDGLLDGGADIEAPGAILGGGSPLDDAVSFGQWQAARRLVERGAQVELWHAAAIGMMDRIDEFFAAEPPPGHEEITYAFWYACHGGQQQAAEYLLERGADLNWIPDWEKRTPLDTAQREGSADLVEWLRRQGGKTAGELKKED